VYSAFTASVLGHVDRWWPRRSSRAELHTLAISTASRKSPKKSNAKDHDQEKNKHGTKGNTKGKGKDNTEDNETYASQKKGPKGWSEIQARQPLTKLANMVVLGRLKKLDKDNGTTDNVNYWKNQKGTDKTALALQFKVGRMPASCLSQRAMPRPTPRRTPCWKGWLTEAQVVAQENFRQWSYCDSQKSDAAWHLGWVSKQDQWDFIFGCQGPQQYEYYAKASTHITKEHTGNIEYMAEANVDNGKDFDSLFENLDSTMQFTGTSNKPKPLRAKPNKELTGIDKVKVDWMKYDNKFQADLDKEQKAVLQLRINGSAMMKDKTIGVSKEMVQAYKKLRMTSASTWSTSLTSWYWPPL